MKNALVTGASGFLGSALVEALALRHNYRPIAATRQADIALPNGADVLHLKDYEDIDRWRSALIDVEVVIHAAARAHVLQDTAKDPLDEFRRANVEASLNLARAAADVKVRRFVFISSIGVNGHETLNVPFDEATSPQPRTPYAQSKLEAETGLQHLAEDTGMELVIVRPPLVYASNAPGNFKRLLRLIASGLPIPFAWVNNQRSAIARDNLVDFLMLCLDHPKAANELFVIADGDDFSTPDMVRMLALGMKRPARLLPVPMPVLRFGAQLFGRAETYRQLCGSLVIDIAKAQSYLGWRPPLSAKTALIAAGADFTHRNAAAR